MRAERLRRVAVPVEPVRIGSAHVLQALYVFEHTAVVRWRRSSSLQHSASILFGARNIELTSGGRRCRAITRRGYRSVGHIFFELPGDDDGSERCAVTVGGKPVTMRRADTTLGNALQSGRRAVVTAAGRVSGLGEIVALESDDRHCSLLAVVGESGVAGVTRDMISDRAGRFLTPEEHREVADDFDRARNVALSLRLRDDLGALYGYTTADTLAPGLTAIHFTPQVAAGARSLQLMTGSDTVDLAWL